MVNLTIENIIPRLAALDEEWELRTPRVTSYEDAKWRQVISRERTRLKKRLAELRGEVMVRDTPGDARNRWLNTLPNIRRVPLVIFGRPECTSCTALREDLTAAGRPFMYVDLSLQPDLTPQVTTQSGSLRLPIVLEGGEWKSPDQLRI